MYDLVYQEMEISGVATELEKPIYMDRVGNFVEKENAYGLKVTHRITHPQYILHGDEVGNNKNQRSDGSFGVEKRLASTKNKGSKISS